MIPVEADIALCVRIFFLVSNTWRNKNRAAAQRTAPVLLQKLLVTDLRCADQRPLKKLFGHKPRLKN